MNKFSGWFVKVVVELGKDLTSLRATWAWVYLTLFAFLAVYGALKVHEAFSTIVTVTGGVVSVIFSGYVLTKLKGPTDDDSH